MGTASWTQAQIGQLERAIQNQKDLLLKLDQGLAEGRIENQVYSEISKRRSHDVGDLERQLAERKAQLAREGSVETQGKDSL